MDEPGVSGKGDLVIELSPLPSSQKLLRKIKDMLYATEEELNVEDCWIFVFGEDKNILRLSIFLAMLYRKLRMNM